MYTCNYIRLYYIYRPFFHDTYLESVLTVSFVDDNYTKGSALDSNRVLC